MLATQMLQFNNPPANQNYKSLNTRASLAITSKSKQKHSISPAAQRLRTNSTKSMEDHSFNESARATIYN